jgi:hypothetical protein
MKQNVGAVQIFTNSYTVGFGDINRGLNLRSEFLDYKWRALLAEVDMSYRQRNGTSDLPFTLDEDISMCDWRSSFSDGTKLFSFPVPWPIKPAHASEFYSSNTLQHVLDYSGAISSASWSTGNYYVFPEIAYNASEVHPLAFTWKKGGTYDLPTPDETRIWFLDKAWRERVSALQAAGKGPPAGFRPCQTHNSAFRYHFLANCTCSANKQCTDDAWCNVGDRCRDAIRFVEIADATGCQYAFHCPLNACLVALLCAWIV